MPTVLRPTTPQVLHRAQLDDRKLLTSQCTQVDDMYESLAAHEQKVPTADQVKHDDLREALANFQAQLTEVCARVPVCRWGQGVGVLQQPHGIDTLTSLTTSQHHTCLTGARVHRGQQGGAGPDADRQRGGGQRGAAGPHRQRQHRCGRTAHAHAQRCKVGGHAPSTPPPHSLPCTRNTPHQASLWTRPRTWRRLSRSSRACCST